MLCIFLFIYLFIYLSLLFYFLFTLYVVESMSVCQKRHYLSVLVCRTRYALHACVVLLVSMILGIPLKIYHLPQGILKSAQLIEPDIHCIILFFFFCFCSRMRGFILFAYAFRLNRQHNWLNRPLEQRISSSCFVS